MRVFLLLLICGLLGSGCLQTRETEAERQARERAIEQRLQQQRLAEERQRMQLQLEDTESRMTNSQRELQELRARVGDKTDRAELQRLEQRMAALEQQMQALEARRAKDREEMIEILSQRMATLMARQAPAAPSGGTRSHVVAQGETLSAIAAAYRVRDQDIISLNQLQNPNALRVGQRLLIP